MDARSPPAPPRSQAPHHDLRRPCRSHVSPVSVHRPPQARDACPLRPRPSCPTPSPPAAPPRGLLCSADSSPPPSVCPLPGVLPTRGPHLIAAGSTKSMFPEGCLSWPSTVPMPLNPKWTLLVLSRGQAPPPWAGCTLPSQSPAPCTAVLLHASTTTLSHSALFTCQAGVAAPLPYLSWSRCGSHPGFPACGSQACRHLLQVALLGFEPQQRQEGQLRNEPQAKCAGPVSAQGMQGGQNLG